MQKYKCRIFISFISFVLATISYLALSYLLLTWIIDFELKQVTTEIWIVFSIIYLVVAYLYLSYFNNDIVVYDNSIEVINRLPPFRRKFHFPLYEVKSIQFRHDWTESIGRNIKPYKLGYWVGQIATLFFPSDYKWIKIESDKTYRFYCFGLEYDFYDNKNPHFEDLYSDLSKRNVTVSWTNSIDKRLG